MRALSLKDLYKKAHSVLGNAYAPYSGHPVAAALVSEEGNVFVGCNHETANHDSICAEGSAIAAMITGEKGAESKISKIAVVGPGEDLCTPCGNCRQRIREFATPDTLIAVFSESGKLLREYEMDDLLPDSFGPENLPVNQVEVALKL